MTASGSVPLTVTRENIADFERETGFVGIGRRMVRAGIWKLANSGDGDKNVTKC